MRKDITIVADVREERGKNAAFRLRAAGKSPATVYGLSSDPVAIAISPKEIGKILQSASGHNTVFTLDISGKENTLAMIIDWQLHPVKETILHVDLLRIDPAKRIHVKIPVHTSGDPKGVKIQGGIYDIVTREIEIECLPNDIPESYNVDVTELLIGQSVRASDIPLAGSAKLLSAPDLVISHVVSGKASAETETDANAEPEVVKKGKKEDPDAKKK